MKNWRTTLIGAAFAAVTFVSTYQTNGGNLDDWKLWVLPTLAAALGYVAKDAGVTGTLKLLIGCLCLLILPSCKTPQQTQRLGQLVSLAVDVAVKRGALSADDALAIREAKTIILPAEAESPPVEASGK